MGPVPGVIKDIKHYSLDSCLPTARYLSSWAPASPPTAPQQAAFVVLGGMTWTPLWATAGLS